MLIGKNITLEIPDQKHFSTLCKVKPCDDFFLMVGEASGESVFSSLDSLKKSFLESLKRENYWYIVRESEVIGVALLHSLNEKDKHARYAVAIFNKENWNKGYGYEITQCVLEYAFKKLKLHRIDLRVLDYNKRAIESYKKNGFIEEGLLRENAFINEKWHNDVIMSILSCEFKTKF